MALCLTLLLIGGFAVTASAQQPTAPATAPAAPADPRAPDNNTAQPSPSPATPAPAPQLQQTPPPSTQTETRTAKTERIVEREPGKFLGVDPTVAMILGAALLIVIVFALVAMSRRRDEVQHTHTRA
jgi:carbohydrate-binding DOMON domain-containing protein